MKDSMFHYSQRRITNRSLIVMFALVATVSATAMVNIVWNHGYVAGTVPTPATLTSVGMMTVKVTCCHVELIHIAMLTVTFSTFNEPRCGCLLSSQLMFMV